MNLKAGWGPLTLLLCILLAACAAWIHIMALDGNLRWRWVAVVGILIAFCLVAGVLVNGRLVGILIDDRNRISLARLQWVAWLIVILSGYFVEALWNATQAKDFPKIQAELFILLGIVSGSPVVSDLIIDTKKRTPQSPPTSQVQQTELRLAEGDSRRQKGSIDVNRCAAEASWADLYLGEEVANRYVVDVSRLQKLVVTVLLVVTFVVWLWRDLGTLPELSDKALDMPKVSEQFLWLLGISHSAYLANKATPKTPS